jgi:hypothetical protein
MADEFLLRALRLPMELLTDGMRMIQFVSKAREAADELERNDAEIRKLEMELEEARHLLGKAYEAWQSNSDPSATMNQIRHCLKRIDANRDPLDAPG